VKRDFLTLAGVPREDWPRIWGRAAELKKSRAEGKVHRTLEGKAIAVVLEKASTRTRVSFEVGIQDLGGTAVILSSQGSQIARGEPIEDTARVLSGYCHAIVLRTFGQDRVEAMARAAWVPVINGLTDQHHPCQVASDLLTVIERLGGPVGPRYAWIGDGNNMAASWIEAAGLFGFDLAVACPERYKPDPEIVAQARARQGVLGKGTIELTDDPRVAARHADVVSTDVWASMGQEEEAEARRRAFVGYCVDDALLSHASQRAIVLHCLPAHRGEEITAAVMEGPRSAIWQQAENRMHVQKALLEYLLA
jgi:ornithine carbamoyltransferase